MTVLLQRGIAFEVKAFIYFGKYFVWMDKIRKNFLSRTSKKCLRGISSIKKLMPMKLNFGINFGSMPLIRRLLPGQGSKMFRLKLPAPCLFQDMCIRLKSNIMAD